MALRQTQMTTTAAAQKLVQAEGRRRGLILKNHDTTIHVRLGSSTVATSGASGGMQLRAGETLNLVEGPFPQEEWWVIPESGTPIVSAVESLA